VRILALKNYKEALQRNSWSPVSSVVPWRYKASQTCAFALFALGLTMLVAYAVLLAMFHP